jgi:hypothetical protein
MYERNPMTEKQRDRRTMILLGLEAVGLIAAAVVVSFIAGGCGEKRQEGATASAGPSAIATPDAAVAAVTPGQSGTPQPENDPVAYADSLPPEVAVSVADSHVVPGAAVEITAEGSGDVTDLLLSDGVGRPQAFVYDVSGKVWRTFYRVPMKRSLDRVALSVTAKNGSSHWRRVWLFLDIEREPAATQPDSTSQR